MFNRPYHLRHLPPDVKTYTHPLVSFVIVSVLAGVFVFISMVGYFAYLIVR